VGWECWFGGGAGRRPVGRAGIDGGRGCERVRQRGRGWGWGRVPGRHGGPVGSAGSRGLGRRTSGAVVRGEEGKGGGVWVLPPRADVNERPLSPACPLATHAHAAHTRTQHALFRFPFRFLIRCFDPRPNQRVGLSCLGSLYYLPCACAPRGVGVGVGVRPSPARRRRPPPPPPPAFFPLLFVAAGCRGCGGPIVPQL
jgi:hypothetical protein